MRLRAPQGAWHRVVLFIACQILIFYQKEINFNLTDFGHLKDALKKACLLTGSLTISWKKKFFRRTEMSKNKTNGSGDSTILIKDTLANPAPLGLLGFGMTTVLLNIHNAGFYPLGSMILAMGIFYGGLAQVIAGIMEFKKSNTFGATAFTSYGLFWLSLVALLVMPRMGIAEAASNTGMICYLIMWGIFTTCMFIGTLNKNRVTQFVFGSLAVLFFLLALGDATGNATIKTVTGFEGIICGFSAIYDAVAQILNETYGREVLPTWPVN